MSATETVRRQASEAADKALAKHVLVREGDGRWFAGAPGTRCYSFRVIVSPGCVILHGDVGELILCPHDRDALAWLRGTLRDGREIDYPLSKVQPRMCAEEVFLPKLAREELASALRDARNDGEDVRTDEWRALRDSLSHGNEDDAAAAWDLAFSELRHDWEFPSARYWSPSLIFRLECLRWFVAHLTPELAGN